MPSWRDRRTGQSSSHGPSQRTPRTPEPFDQDSYFPPPSQLPYEHNGAYPATGPARPPPQQAPSSPQKSSHGRSLSQTLPSLFGVNKKKANTNEESLSKSGPSGGDAMAPVGGSPKKKGRADDNESEVGTCATCESKVKWPKGLNEFRCSTCLMINDLQPLRRSFKPGASAAPQANGKDTAGGERRVPPLSIDRTKVLVEQCIDTFLATRKQKSQSKIPTPPHSPQNHPEANVDHILGLSSFPPLQRTLLDEKYLSDQNQDVGVELLQRDHSNQADGVIQTPTAEEDENNAWRDSNNSQSQVRGERPAIPTRKPPPPPRANPNPYRQRNGDAVGQVLSSPSSLHRRQVSNSLVDKEAVLSKSKQDTARSIFKPLEDYIISHFGNHDSLNISFSTARPKPHRDVRSEEDVRPRNLEPNTSPPAQPTKMTLSQLDAKTLLIGDVAENGLWWTGRDGNSTSQRGRPKRERSYDNQRSFVTSRNPRINWTELMAWYELVVNAGGYWKERLDKMEGTGSTESPVPDQSDETELKELFAYASAHVSRTLLKTSEALLKRPGRPLREPDDVRFLLLVLANPLLHEKAPQISSHRKRDNSATLSAPSDRFEKHADSDRSPTFGIIKRIFGLISNLPNECHRYLTLWFARLDEIRFRETVELVQTFITHRMKRQEGRIRSNSQNPATALIPNFSGTAADTTVQLHAAIGLGPQAIATIEASKSFAAYSTDWQIKAGAKAMALLFTANKNFYGDRLTITSTNDARSSTAETVSRHNIKNHGQLMSTSDFYNSMVDYIDLIADFDTWETAKGRFSYCQYPFFLSVGSKIRIMEHDARRQMEVKAREAFFNSILRNKNLEQFLTLRVRRDCLVEDSLKTISEVVGSGQEDIKKGLKVQFINEEGVDAGGLRKEWFQLLVREIFDAHHGLFLYDEDSLFCYFNPHSFETSDQFFLVGALLGLAIYNSTILDVPLPPFTFKKLLMAGPAQQIQHSAFNRSPLHYTLEDLAEYRPRLAHGLRQLLEFDGNVEETYCRDFVAEVDRYGSIQRFPLCSNGENRAVTNANRQEFVDLYIRYLIDTQVNRQFEPFKRGFFTVCGGNALSLFQPEEIELLVRGSDEPLDVPSLKAVAAYDNWGRGEQKIEHPEKLPLIQWFWQFFEDANPKDQRRILSFITGSDRIPAVGALNLVIKIAYAGRDYTRFPIARTCFNLLMLYKYRTEEELANKLWRAVTESEGFGLK